MNEIELLKNNEAKEADDVEWMQEFFNFLQETVKLSPKKAFWIIHYLQEHLPVFPDHIEKCWRCGKLYDVYSEGLHWETRDRFYCGSCMYEVPENYDRGKR